MALAAAIAIALTACGSEDEPEADSTNGSEAAQDESAGGEGGQPTGGPESLSPPQAKESIGEATKRFTAAIDSGECDRIITLNPLSRPVEDEEARRARCDLLESRLGDATAGHANAYGRGGGVIAYRGPGANFNAVLILDADGRYHIAYLDSMLPDARVEGKEAAQFEAVADRAVDALRERDCEAFLAVAHRRYGPGALEREQVCEYVENNPIATLFENSPEAKLDSFGGGPDYAFYGIGGPGAYQTLVFARESDEGLPPSAEPLPKDAPEYALAGTFRTKLSEPASDG